ncbi:MAG: ABC transporter substrate-binding protein [Actinomycetia bacterium]|nr:ABC transporter substrate-binding protein [Actinomycetes bacterium]
MDRPTRQGRGGFAAAASVALGLILVAGLMWVTGCGPSETDVETTAAQETTTTSAAPVTTAPTVETTTTGSPKLEKLTLVAPPGPMAIPLAYIAINDKLAGVAEDTELMIWENADQLKAMVAGGQGDLVTMPSNNAAIFYNKGLELRLLNISVWNITYLVTGRSGVDSFSDIKGRSLVVSLQGSVPDVMFQYMAMKEGLDPQKDFKLQYVSEPTQAAQLLLAGKVENAVLSEALATAAVLQSKSTEKPLQKAFAFDAAWAKATGGSAPTTIAGTVATAGVMDKPWVIAAFEREYQAAVDWMLANPTEAGQLVETELPQLGLKAAVMTASLKSITWKYTPAAEARASLEAFYTALSELSPEVIGGRLPDDGFYYTP